MAGVVRGPGVRGLASVRLHRGPGARGRCRPGQAGHRPDLPTEPGPRGHPVLAGRPRPGQGRRQALRHKPRRIPGSQRALRLAESQREDPSQPPARPDVHPVRLDHGRQIGPSLLARRTASRTDAPGAFRAAPCLEGTRAGAPSRARTSPLIDWQCGMLIRTRGPSSSAPIVQLAVQPSLAPLRCRVTAPA